MPVHVPPRAVAVRAVLLAAVVFLLGSSIASPVRGQDVADQIRQLQEADQRRQAELEQLKAANEALQQKVQRLSPADKPAAEAADAPPAEHPVQYEGGSIDPQYNDPNRSLTQPGSPVAKAASAGYNLTGGAGSPRGGFFIQNADETFSIHFHNRLQFGYTYDHFNHPLTRNGIPSVDRLEDRSDFHFVREYFTVNGNLWTKDLYYHVTFEAFTAPPLNETMRLRYDWVDFNVLHGLGCVDDYSVWRNALVVRAGMWKGRFGREFPANDGQLQLVDRSLATIAFNEGRIRGAEVHGSMIYFDKDLNQETHQPTGPGRFAYFIEVGDSIDDPTSAFALDSSQLGTPAAGATPRGLDILPFISARLQYDILRGFYTYVSPDGKVTRYDDFRFDEANDLAYHEEPALQVGINYAFDPDNFDTRPQDFPLMDRFFKGKIVHRYDADLGFKYRGFSFTAEYFLENIDARPQSIFSSVNGSTGAPIPPEQRGSHGSSGWYARSGYFIIPRRLELYGRISGLYSGNLTKVLGTVKGVPILGDGAKITDAWEYTSGIGYYPTGHHYLKFQLECGYNTNVPLSNEKPEFVSETHESDFIVRAQFQVEF